MSPRGRRWDATKFIDINLIKEHLAMKTILAIDLGAQLKNPGVFFGGLGNLRGIKDTWGALFFVHPFFVSPSPSQFDTIPLHRPPAHYSLFISH